MTLKSKLGKFYIGVLPFGPELLPFDFGELREKGSSIVELDDGSCMFLQAVNTKQFSYLEFESGNIAIGWYFVIVALDDLSSDVSLPNYGNLVIEGNTLQIDVPGRPLDNYEEFILNIDDNQMELGVEIIDLIEF